MTTTEHLQRIKTKCEELLAIAEKRTPGEWDAKPIDQRQTEFGLSANGKELVWTYPQEPYWISKPNATFIASCAGPAEAGWRSTIAAIEALPAITYSEFRYRAEADIIAAWPEELLK
jgi:hypothetical protein